MTNTRGERGPRAGRGRAARRALERSRGGVGDVPSALTRRVAPREVGAATRAGARIATPRTDLDEAKWRAPETVAAEAKDVEADMVCVLVSAAGSAVATTMKRSRRARCVKCARERPGADTTRPHRPRLQGVAQPRDARALPPSPPSQHSARTRNRRFKTDPLVWGICHGCSEIRSFHSDLTGKQCAKIIARDARNKSAWVVSPRFFSHRFSLLFRFTQERRRRFFVAPL